MSSNSLDQLPSVARASSRAIRFDSAPSTKFGRVLLIEDDANLRSAITIQLRRSGYDCVPTESGTDGLELFAGMDPDVVITDLGLPGMRGLKLLHELRASGIAVPVIVVTGDQRDEVEKQVRSSGAVAVFHKPFQPWQLVACVGEALTNRVDR